ncbi:MAG: hypothetical protein RIS36_1184 [Pseudomonadota bacterium]|jgi:uncharacterized membrane protein YsdA (DUF1294 family)
MGQSVQRPYLFFGMLSGGIAVLAALLAWWFADRSIFTSALIGVNIAALGSMGLDKSFARSEAPRIPEVVLYVLALLGGSPGILAGIHIFKHKTRKAAFQCTLLVVFASQVALLRMLEYAAG